ncbi:MAG TPA: peptidyl-alpha-hydroxyglycine alpha-amidating lyase family protein [Vicinamibacterales bacterium]|nr:peptidyl-alpha-hydroxyglycine alpha-amidating lyase family protein [Vicinamibacterales bacterium]
MRKSLLVALAIALSTTSALLQEKGGDDRTGPYDVVANWPQPLAFAKPGYIWGSTGGIFAESPDRIFVANRGELKLPPTLPPGFTGFWGSFNEQATTPTPEFRNCIVVVDRNGKAVESWTQWDYLFADGRGPHSVLISPYDPAHNVWVVDDIHHQIFEFTNDGKRMLMSLGVRDEAGSDGTHFKRPTDIAWLPDGTFFISDGYGNTRVAKFDKNGKFLMAWGTRGTGNGEFNTPHSITIDKNRRVYVSDRANNRIQVFDENGKYLDQFPRITQPYHIRISDDQFLWAFSGPLDKLMKYDLNGRLLYAWGTHGTTPGLFWAVHEFSVDSEGNFYTAEVFGGRSQKFHPREGADPSHFFKPQPLVPKTAAPSSTDGHGPEEKPASTPMMSGGPKAGTDVSGSWTLATAVPAPPSGRGRGAAGGGIGGPYADSLFAQAPPSVTIAQTGKDVTIQVANAKAIYTFDGATNSVPPGEVLALKTRAHWEGPALHLHYKQGMNWGRDVVTINGRTLTIVRDLESGGQSTTRTLTYTKTS